MADRYFADTPIGQRQARLIGAEAHHLTHVMRAKPGTEVVLFDGSGAQWSARVTAVLRSEVELEVIAREEVNRELLATITLGVALPKGDRQKWLVEKSVELGVARLVPLICEHTNDRTSPSALERLKRGVIEASKQCGRNHLMEIAAPQKLSEFLAAADPGTVRLLAHPGGEDCARVLERASFDASREILLAVGPEGGFSNTEVATASHENWNIVGLGPAILRVETAALSLTTAVALHIQRTLR